MRYVLVNPDWTFVGSIYFGCREPHLPLEFGYARALLEAAGHEVLILDGQLDAMPRAAMRETLERYRPDITVLTTGLTALFLFGTEVAPLSDGIPSRWHHLGFVVDDLEKCYFHLREHGAEIVSDYTLLERDERWSLYCHYRNGDVVFMIQFSEIRDGYRGVHTDATAFMYDYLRGRYGIRFTDRLIYSDLIGDLSRHLKINPL